MLLIVLVVVLVVVALLAVLLYNRLVRLRNKVADSWAGIDVQLVRRADLVPNLVNVVRGYKVHERETLEAVTAARAAAQSASGPAEAGAAEERLGQSLMSLFAVAEAYPELKADGAFRDLQSELSTLEEEIAFARRYYNSVVRDYNTSQQTFPSSLLAGPFGFREAEYFRAQAGDTKVPDATI